MSLQLLIFEYAVIGMWCYAGIVTGYMGYINNYSTSSELYDTFAASLLSIYQVRTQRCMPVLSNVEAKRVPLDRCAV